MSIMVIFIIFFLGILFIVLWVVRFKTVNRKIYTKNGAVREVILGQPFLFIFQFLNDKIFLYPKIGIITLFYLDLAGEFALDYIQERANPTQQKLQPFH